MNLIKSVVYKLTGTENPLELALFTVYGAFLLFVINSVLTGV
jgi:hypothetical protein